MNNEKINELLEKAEEKHLTNLDHQEVGSKEAGDIICDLDKINKMLDVNEANKLREREIAVKEKEIEVNKELKLKEIEVNKEIETIRERSEKFRFIGDIVKSGCTVLTTGMVILSNKDMLKKMIRTVYDSDAANIPKDLLSFGMRMFNK